MYACCACWCHLIHFALACVKLDMLIAVCGTLRLLFAQHFTQQMLITNAFKVAACIHEQMLRKSINWRYEEYVYIKLDNNAAGATAKCNQK